MNERQSQAQKELQEMQNKFSECNQQQVQIINI